MALPLPTEGRVYQQYFLGRYYLETTQSSIKTGGSPIWDISAQNQDSMAFLHLLFPALLRLRQRPLLNIKNWAPASQLHVNSVICWSQDTGCEALLGCVSSIPLATVRELWPDFTPVSFQF
jgi:hypothetical protein